MVTAVSGGIGCGKSVVCRILQTLGYEVYDCDSRAKAIMDADAGIKLWSWNADSNRLTANGWLKLCLMMKRHYLS